MFTPYKTPAKAHNNSPLPKEMLSAPKFMPLKINIPTKHSTLETIVNKLGFFFMAKNKIIGTTTHEMFSKNAYLVGVV